MLKSVLSLLLAQILLIAPFGCSMSVTPSATIEVKDFYIIYERDPSDSIAFIEWDQFGNAISITSKPENQFKVLLDTKNNILGRVFDLQGQQYAYISIHMPPEDLQAIYDAVIKYDIKSLSSPDVLSPDEWVLYGNGYYRITFFLEGEVYSVTYRERVIYSMQPAYQNLRSFHTVLNYYYKNTDEYKSFPPVMTTAA
ncbi:MAG: hypothetical protein FWH51_00980 [Dehalococcoidia bacterium]|nr:hypothetical protein [Dehalococcoidia bacterium]